MLPLGVGGSPRGPRAALRRLQGVYSPTHYYVRVSRGGKLHRHWAFFTGTGLASYRQTRAPPCATLYCHRRRPETEDAADGIEQSPAVPPTTTGSLPGVGPGAPSRQRAYLLRTPCSEHRVGEAGSWPLSYSPRCPPPKGWGAAGLGQPPAATTYTSCDPWLAYACS